MSFLLVIIYLSFISLGLPDGLLGSSWLSINAEFNMPNYAAGIISLIISCGTVVSSLNCQRLLKKFGTGVVTLFSVLLTAIALIGNSLASSFLWFCLCAVPMGIGAGAVDAALNYFVAKFYKARHMNWLHCFWGIGATGGPIIMAIFLSKNLSWRLGFQTIFVVQITLVLILALSLPLWKKFDKKPLLEKSVNEIIPFNKIIKLKGVKPALLSFFCYCSSEALLGLWGSSYLVLFKNISVSTAALYISFYYLGITVGRMLAGFLSMKIKSKNMIYIGIAISLVGAVILILPLSGMFSLIGIILTGLGFAPIYPSMLHETPKRFGQNNSSALMGIQMASAYVGTTTMPLLFGYLITVISPLVLPIGIVALMCVMCVATVLVNKATDKREMI